MNRTDTSKSRISSVSETVPDSVRSTASIMGHPLHPIAVALPIGALVFALLSDIGYATSQNPFWAEASRWLLLAGLITGALAAVLGLIDFLTIPYVRRRTAAWVHFLGNGVALVLALVNLLSRPEDPQAGVPDSGLPLSLIVVLILLVTGWLGGELAYRYRVGVVPREEVSVN